MPAHKSPRYTASEDAILREHYPARGVEGVRAMLPGRSWHSIHVRAHRLGVQTGFRGAAPTPRLAGEQLEQAIRLRQDDGWSFARIGAHFGVAEAAACNAVMIALCVRQGFRPAERDERGHLTAEGLERVRYALKKGLKGVDIQLRLGVSASCVAEQRRRYNRDLESRGKALLPPAGGGVRYSGAKLTRQERKAVEALFLEGLGTLKVSIRTGVSKTSCVRIRERLVKRLRRKGECLPGCDINGVRRRQAVSAQHVHPSQREALRALLLDRVPVSRAARMVAVGSCSAFRIRDELAAELAREGQTLPLPILPGRGKVSWQSDPHWPPTGPSQLFAFRALLHDLSFDDAKARWRRERAEERRAAAARPKTFEDHLAMVSAGARIVQVAARTHLEPRLGQLP